MTVFFVVVDAVAALVDFWIAIKSAADFIVDEISRRMPQREAHTSL